ncbi:hypothetical protein Micbo1qcDRAFT_233554 [Microdochium bolleyi]|uniref:B30.2/SPRY domain-containing protein n=1 Tax=Microdochium bolleyi TaxID=196109 RepID=A0A136J4Z2_9PEZI|nr:hypothetical protein Micbo1qcDRAFT_233554 [Microdochium bolleyi]
MSESNEASSRRGTPAVSPVPPSGIPQKRAFNEDDHAPPVSSPLNPNPSLETKPVRLQSHDEPSTGREKPSRTKKETLKKRESKGGVAESARSTPAPKAGKSSPPSEAAPLRYKLAAPKPGDFEPARGPYLVHHHDVPAPDGSTIAFHETSEHVYNKKNYHYLHCIADPTFPSSFYYRQTEPAPYDAHMCFEDAATHMYFDPTGRHVTTDKGFRMARANVAVRQGRWYWECKITRGTVNSASSTAAAAASSAPRESHGHVRMGFARREASLDAPVGFDAYSYGIRDVEGQKVHMSRPKDFFPAGEEIKEGDVIGLEIRLPSEHLHRKVVHGEYNPAVDLAEEEEGEAARQHVAAEAANIVRDRIPIRFKAHIYFEKIDYHTSKELEDLMNPSPVGASGSAGSSTAEKPNPNHPVPALRTLPQSYIKVYKNGVLMGTAFEDLLAFLPPASKPQAQVGARDGLDDGMLGYYPAISVFRGGAAEVNFGPDFWYPPPLDTVDGRPGETADVEMADASATAEAPAAEGASSQNADKSSSSRGNDPAGTLRPVSDRFSEQIVEDIVADVIDEVSFWMQDGGRVVDRTRTTTGGGGSGGSGGGSAGAGNSAGFAPSAGVVGGGVKADGGSGGLVPPPVLGGGGREEIKELVQDD